MLPKPYFVDTHSHVYYEKDPIQRSQQIAFAQAENVQKLYLPNVDLASLPALLDTIHTHPNCYGMIGLHPCAVDDTYTNTLSILASYLNQAPWSAIGEIGLDLYHDKSHLEAQKAAFIQQIDWANDYELPVVLHVRNAFEETMQVLKKRFPKKKGIFHCFSGSYEQACRVLDLGFLLGIGGVVTYKNTTLPATLAQLSLQDIVLETDAPYLSPVPHRGKANQSAYLPYVGAKVAEIFKTDINTVAKITTQNAATILKKQTY